ncbi:cytochrome c oxidase copper chaperone [Arapaima gigas]
MYVLHQAKGSVTMSSLSAASCASTPAGGTAEEKKPLKPCCACPETKKARDACIIEKDLVTPWGVGERVSKCYGGCSAGS